MSVEAMNWAYKQVTGSPTRKAILVALSNQADQDGRCWPSIAYLSDRTELSQRTVIRGISELENQGFLEREIRPGDGSGRVSNVYQLHIGQSDTHDRQSDTVSGQGDTVTPKQSITINKQSKGGGRSAFLAYAKQHDAEQVCEDWFSVLKKKKAATTEHSWELRLKKITALAAAGHAPLDVLQQSSQSGWSDLYPPKAPRAEYIRLPYDNQALWAIRKAIGMQPIMHTGDAKACHAEINQYLAKHPEHRPTVQQMVGA